MNEINMNLSDSSLKYEYKESSNNKLYELFGTTNTIYDIGMLANKIGANKKASGNIWALRQRLNPNNPDSTQLA